MIARLLVTILLVIARPIVNGIFWAIGAAIGDALLRSHIKEWINMLARTRLLFHPSVTRIAVLCSALLNLSGLLTALGTATPAMKGVFGTHASLVAGVLILAGILCGQIAGWGRSTIPAVDNNTPPAP